MGMFDDLNRLNKQQQEASELPQVPTIEVSSHLSAPSTAPPVALNATTHKTKATVKPRKKQILSTAPIHEDVVPVTTDLSTFPQTPQASVRTNERTKIRHSFDIFQDQLFALRDLAYEREHGSLKKVPLGDLVQEALDMYLVAQGRPK